jgi:hypothetical protein
MLITAAVKNSKAANHDIINLAVIYAYAHQHKKKKYIRRRNILL